MNKKSLDTLLDEARELYEQDKNIESAALAHTILHRAKEEKNLFAQAHALNTLGTTFYNQNLYEEALEHYLAAEKILSSIGHEKQTVPSLINIAIIYNKQKLVDKAVESYTKALSLIEGEPLSMLHAQIHNGIGNVYSDNKQADHAYLSFEKVLAISSQLNIPYGKALALSNMACVAIKLGQPLLAIDLADKTLAISREFDFAMLSLIAQSVLADALFLQQNYTDGIAAYQSLLPQIEAINRDDMLLEAYTQLQEAYLSSKNFENAFLSAQKLAEVTARVNSVERTKVLNAMQVRYETEKKEIAIRELQLSNEKAERRKVEAELQSLRSRMNPHFVYNVMNTIHGLIQLNKKQAAIEAVERFAQLNRLTLEQSSRQEVTVLQEIELLKNYIETEQLLMGSSFTYTLTIDEHIEQDFTFLPSLLVQPFVENAIKHGLQHQVGEKVLNVHFDIQNDSLRVIIKDNGVGLLASNEKNKRLMNKPKSFATSAVRERLALVNQSRTEPIRISVNDLLNTSSNQTGVEVVIYIPSVS